MRGRVRVAHLSSSAEKIVSFRLFGLTVMFLMTGVRLDSLTSAAWSCCGKVSRPCHPADRRSPVPRRFKKGDLRSGSRRGQETRAEKEFAVRPEVLLGSGPTITW